MIIFMFYLFFYFLFNFFKSLCYNLFKLKQFLCNVIEKIKNKWNEKELILYLYSQCFNNNKIRLL